MKKKYKENPNDKAEIGFVIFYPFQFYVYKNVYKHFDNAEFIVDLGAFYPIDQPDQLDKDIVSLLRKQKVYFRVFYYEDYLLKTYTEKFFSKYRTLVSVWERGCYLLACNADKRKINITYGSGKELTMVRPSRRYHDLILAFGKRDSKLFSYYTESKIVGNPKFDDWFNDEINKELLSDIRTKLDLNKKTVLYLPTHGDLCSIDNLAKELKKVSSDYNTIVKLHYFNVHEEKERVEKLRHKNIILFGDDIDLLPLLKIADVVISDNSSAIFDVILADKPVVVTDFLSEEYLNEGHKDIRFLRRGRAGAATYSNSIEQVIKKEKQVITIKKPRELSHAIQIALGDPDRYREARKKIREELFAFNDGKCGQRAAQAILKLQEAKEQSQRPILFHVIEAYEREIGLRTLFQKNRDKKTIQEYENILFNQIEKGDENKVCFSVVVLVQQGEEVFLKECARSLINQKYPENNYEIIVIGSKSTAQATQIINEIDKNNQRIPQIKFFSFSNDFISGENIKKAMDKAKGEIVCFTRANYLLPSDWLMNFYITYQKFPDIAGAGGYVRALPPNRTIYDEYYYLEIGKKTGVWKELHYLEKLEELNNNLFFQNPAGSLDNMSYKKSILEQCFANHKEQMVEFLELEIKRKIISDNEIAFIPSVIWRLNKLTFRKFIQRNFLEGIAFYLLCQNDPQLKRHYDYSLLLPLKLLMLNILDGYWKFSLSGIIFLGSFYRWLGGIYARTLSMKARLQG